jgi:hypothetical protein
LIKDKWLLFLSLANHYQQNASDPSLLFLLARGWFYWFAKPSFPRLSIYDALFGNKVMLACFWGFIFVLGCFLLSKAPVHKYYILLLTTVLQVNQQ